MMFLVAITILALQTVTSSKPLSQIEKTREPNSINPVDQLPPHAVTPSFSFKADCLEEMTIEKNLQYPFVRISAENCKRRKSETIKITNVTNGYQASVFKTGTISFTSDLIRLKPGENRILIVQKFADGSDYRRTVTVVNNSNLNP